MGREKVRGKKKEVFVFKVLVFFYNVLFSYWNWIQFLFSVGEVVFWHKGSLPLQTESAVHNTRTAASGRRYFLRQQNPTFFTPKEGFIATIALVH